VAASFLVLACACCFIASCGLCCMWAKCSQGWCVLVGELCAASCSWPLAWCALSLVGLR
jgi:hypothetical protein